MKILDLYIAVLLSVLIIGVPQSFAGQSKFFESLYDVPIMPGLEEVPDMALSFDKPDGRIAEAGARVSGVDNQSIWRFYEQSLVQMGWTQMRRGVFTRENEKLRVFIEESPLKTGKKSTDSRIIRFLLSPL